MKKQHLITTLLFIIGLTFCMTLSQAEESSTSNPPPQETTVSYWDSTLENSPGPVFVKISLSKQVAYFYKGEVLVGVALVSTGKDGKETPTGEFQVIHKVRNHISGTYGDYVNSSGEVVRARVNRFTTPAPEGATFRGSPMPFYLQFAPKIGIHAGYLPGHPASSGCVRMTHTMAEKFFNHTRVGTRIIVEE